MFAVRYFFGLVLMLGFLAAAAQDHIPIFSTAETGNAPGNAVSIDDANTSHAVYHEVIEEASRLWVTFDLEAGQDIYVQLGVPVLDRLVDSQPAVAVLRPNLPAIDLPFDAPAGLGGILFEPDEIEEPEYFHKRYTATESWIFGEVVDTAVTSGKHYVVAHGPVGQLGEFWVAVGRREVSEPQDIVALPVLVPKVRSCHKVAGPRMIPCFLFAATAAFGALPFHVAPTRARQWKVNWQKTLPGDCK